MPSTVLARNGWSKWPLRQTLANRDGAGPAWRRGKRWFDIPQRAWLRGPLAPFVDEWRRSPHELWSDILDPDQMRRWAGARSAGRRTGPAHDRQVFELVALDQFLRTWFDGVHA